MVRYNKKAFSEIISFGLITMLIIVSSIAAYLFSTEMLDRNIVRLDLENMRSNLKNINYKMSEISQFDGSSFSVNVDFNKGLLVFEGNEVKYVSLSKYDGEEYCEYNVCYNSFLGYEEIYFSLPGTYSYYEDVTLNPGRYVLRFKNIKDGEKIRIYLE